MGRENLINIRRIIVSLESADLGVALLLVEVNGDRSSSASSTKVFLENFATCDSDGHRVGLGISAHFLVGGHVLLLKSSRYARCLTRLLHKGDTSTDVEPVLEIFSGSEI